MLLNPSADWPYSTSARRNSPRTENLQRRALANREKLFGPEHPDVADSLNGLADIDYDQKKYPDAEPFSTSEHFKFAKKPFRSQNKEL